jgi:hypothetical protein
MFVLGNSCRLRISYRVGNFSYQLENTQVLIELINLVKLNLNIITELLQKKLGASIPLITNN